jgi:serine/threonine protein kinase
MNESDGNASGQPVNFQPGQKFFHRYALKRKLGRGGMAVVWLAWDEKLAREVALKFLPEMMLWDAAAVDVLKREASRSLELTHPNIVRIYDFLEEDRIAAISMEYFDGETLSFLRLQQPQKVFEPSDLAQWIPQLCGALDYAHRTAGFVHLDIKPSNLMANEKGVQKLADFGISRRITDTITRVTGKTVAGTMLYMSPQQMRGEPPCISDDLYSVGATLYELLTTAPPFYSGDLFHQVANTVPPSIAERRKHFAIAGKPIPLEWERAIASCLAKAPQDRPASAGELAQRLIAGAQPALSAPEQTISTPTARFPAPPKSGKIGRSWNAGRMAMAASIGLVLALIAVLLISEYKTNAPPSPNTAAATPQSPRPALAANPVPNPLAGPKPGQPWENSLGMKFAYVAPAKTWFSVWETRVQDFSTFVADTGYSAIGGMILVDEATGKNVQRGSWKDPGFKQEGNHPVVGVSRFDAEEFCGWLTKKERAAGRLGTSLVYRLPTDAEWSLAVGLEGEPGNTPAERDASSIRAFPWGANFPPPPGAGNYHPVLAVDTFKYTAPVGSFAPNQYGIYDLGGNVWEWCADWFDNDHKAGVLRGASYRLKNENHLLSTHRQAPQYSAPHKRLDDWGFRAIIAPELPDGKAQSPPPP